jgi:hypothetical protein
MNLMSNLIIEMPRREPSTKNPVETDESRDSVSSNRESSAGVKRVVQIAEEKAFSRLSTDAKIIKILMERQPITMKELERASGVTRETFNDRTDRLNKARVIKELLSGWALSNYEPTSAKVKEALKKLRSEGYVHITLQDVAREARMPPKAIEVDAYLLAPDYYLTIAETSLKLDSSVQKT